MLLRQHGPLSQKILSPRVHSSLECIQASEESNEKVDQYDKFQIKNEIINIE